MFTEVFNPKHGERILILKDLPHNNIKDNIAWKNRRQIAKNWYNIFKKIGENEGFRVYAKEYNATGENNAPIPDKIKEEIKKSNLTIALTEYSASSSLVPIVKAKDSITRAASMPGYDKRMEETALKADYSKVKKFALALKDLLNDSIGAEIEFSTDDKLYIDLRNRIASADIFECKKAGQGINLPAGEACKPPYEGALDEIDQFGESITNGILPVKYNNIILKYKIEKNNIVDIEGNGKKLEEMKLLFKENDTRRNICELGIGCNPNAIITGNVLEDEKVGLHIAYGTSKHLGGKVDSDLHQDICYAKGCLVEGTSVMLILKDGLTIDLIKDAMLRYELLK